MVISFIDGSAVLEGNIEARIKDLLRKIIRTEDQVSFYFFTTNPFILHCEWVVRELQSAYPKKQIESVYIVDCEDLAKLGHPFRFNRVEILEGEAARTPAAVWRWMCDQSDYVICHMDPLLCGDRMRITAFNYAMAKKNKKCFNLCSEWEQQVVRAGIGSLNRRQRMAITGKLLGWPKGDIARTLGVSSKSTVHSYELAAQNSLVKQLGQRHPGRRCAIFEIAAKDVQIRSGNIVYDAIEFLILYCNVNKFIVASRVPLHIMSLLRHFENAYEMRGVRIVRMREVPIDTPHDTLKKDEIIYRTKPGGVLIKIIDERHAMVDNCDVVLCDIVNNYRSGLSYCKKRKIPVINIATLNKENSHPLLIDTQSHGLSDKRPNTR